MTAKYQRNQLRNKDSITYFRKFFASKLRAADKNLAKNLAILSYIDMSQEK